MPFLHTTPPKLAGEGSIWYIYGRAYMRVSSCAVIVMESGMARSFSLSHRGCLLQSIRIQVMRQKHSSFLTSDCATVLLESTILCCCHAGCVASDRDKRIHKADVRQRQRFCDNDNSFHCAPAPTTKQMPNHSVSNHAFMCCLFILNF